MSSINEIRYEKKVKRLEKKGKSFFLKGQYVQLYTFSWLLIFCLFLCLFLNILGKKEPSLISHPDNMTALVSDGFPTHTDLSPDWSEYHNIA